jgi:predicted Rossmann fold nucleotide-binding protein DprA/Smf involved in DNA uptake
VHAEARFALALSALPGVGRRRLRTLLQRRAGHTPTSATDLAEFVRVAGSGLKLRPIEATAVDRAWDAASRLVEACLRRDWRLWIIDAADYPPA